eukprot:1725110-Prymnesium_polylepis.1
MRRACRSCCTDTGAGAEVELEVRVAYDKVSADQEPQSCHCAPLLASTTPVLAPTPLCYFSYISQPNYELRSVSCHSQVFTFYPS